MKKVLYIQPIHPAGMERLAERYEVIVAPDASRETIESLIPEAAAIVTRLTTIDAGLIEKGVKLEAVAKHGVGVDNIDVAAASARGIRVLTTGDANSLSVAEHAFFAIGALCKGITGLDSEFHRGNWACRDQVKAVEVTGKTLGIAGLGKIGSRLAHMAKNGFSMDVAVYDPYLTKDEIISQGCRPVDSIEELCRSADVLSVHVPLSDATRNLIDKKRLALMKPGAFVINFARGGIVNERDLCEALNSKTIAGAAVDVFEQEPPAPDHPYFSTERLILSPHCSTFTEESRARMSLNLADGIEAVLEGREPRFSAN